MRVVGMFKTLTTGTLILLTGNAALAHGLHEAHILPGLTSPTIPNEPIGTSGPKFSLQVPAYSSLPSAAAKLYLDFDGDVTPTWQDYTPGTTPAYDVDFDPTTFSPLELNRIEEIWMRVSEMYSPFNIDVTTVDPGNLNNRQTMRIVIGGNGQNGAPTPWYGTGTIAGGIAYIGGFANDYPNTAFVFPKNLENGDAKYVAIAAAHEAGHGFGLDHQSLWGSGFNKIAEYNPGTAAKAPIMGVAYHSERALWWPGWNFGIIRITDDLDIIQSGVNGFFLREDDHGNFFDDATPLDILGGTVQASGIITETFDHDMFRFTLLEESLVEFSVTGAPFGAMLDPSLRLINADNSIIQTIATASLTESLMATLLPGSYGIGVLSARGYGDIGQFFLSGTITVVPEPAWIAGLLAGAMLLRRRGHA